MLFSPNIREFPSNKRLGTFIGMPDLQEKVRRIVKKLKANSFRDRLKLLLQTIDSIPTRTESKEIEKSHLINQINEWRS